MKPRLFILSFLPPVVSLPLIEVIDTRCTRDEPTRHRNGVGYVLARRVGYALVRSSLVLVPCAGRVLVCGLAPCFGNPGHPPVLVRFLSGPGFSAVCGAS